MSRSSSQRKGSDRTAKRERRRHPRVTKPRKSRAARDASAVERQKSAEIAESCRSCSKLLEAEDRALFVEEEIGRVFCSEECITAYFTPDVERLEKEYFKLLEPGDLAPEEREKLAHLRWITLQEPDEIWRQKTIAGDYRYTLISEFRPGSRSIWCVCICLFLRGEPSFLFISVTSKNTALVNHYRRGERVVAEKPAAKRSKGAAEQVMDEGPTGQPTAEAQMVPTDGLGTEWTEEETRRAQMNLNRRDDDIPEGEFELYQACLEETLQEPTEVWTHLRGVDAEEGEAVEPESVGEVTQSGEEPAVDSGARIYHFIRHYPDESPGMWYVVIARELDDADEIEILDAFPTRDAELVGRYRDGTQEVGEATDTQASSRLVH